MNRRKRATEKRVTIAIPKEEVKTTVGFVVRIHKGRHSAPEIKSRLRKLGLVSKYSAVFMELTKENIGKITISITNLTSYSIIYLLIY